MRASAIELSSDESLYGAKNTVCYYDWKDLLSL